jgi:vacuolar-type H+-ATPase subunit F/Vma7
MRFIVVTAPALGEGFRLAGVETVVAMPGGDVAAPLQSLAVREDIGLVLVTDDVWRTIPERARASLESRARPIVLGIPAGLGEDVEARRTMLGEALQRAMGHRISLSGDARLPGQMA